MELLLIHPQLYHRNCERCLIYAYDEQTGKEQTDNHGQPLIRPPRTYAPCRKPSGGLCPKGTPEEPRTLSARNIKAWRHHRKCKLTGNWPTDNEFAMNKAVELEEVLRQCEMAMKSKERANEINALVSIIAATRGV